MLAEQGKRVSIVTLRGLGEDGFPLERTFLLFCVRDCWNMALSSTPIRVSWR